MTGPSGNQLVLFSLESWCYCNGMFIFRACYTIDNIYFSRNLPLNRATHQYNLLR